MTILEHKKEELQKEIEENRQNLAIKSFDQDTNTEKNNNNEKLKHATTQRFPVSNARMRFRKIFSMQFGDRPEHLLNEIQDCLNYKNREINLAKELKLINTTQMIGDETIYLMGTVILPEARLLEKHRTQFREKPSEEKPPDVDIY